MGSGSNHQEYGLLVLQAETTVVECSTRWVVGCIMVLVNTSGLYMVGSLRMECLTWWVVGCIMVLVNTSGLNTVGSLRRTGLERTVSGGTSPTGKPNHMKVSSH
ncbi:hypothetical protein ZOSMA_163G00230 [Zostera marina]|uniref:Uncharacterized protein n=1 Tax=Zostera marina TaxID=29655 RepID=A0A0K9PTV0_ZOSMR|nr:hypothetical protein ZOSMA_163G00230 [Zostera marina]